MRSAKDQFEKFQDGTVDLLPEQEFRERLERSLASGRPLRVKQGFDPTAPDIHLGHTVGLRKLRQFQDEGHQVVLIVGDYTGLVGDPSGRNTTRPQLTAEEIEINAKTYLEQFYKVLVRDPKPPLLPVEIRRNGEWFAPMGMKDVILLCARYTVARTLERDDFAKRWEAKHPISVHELLYPLMQGFDSVMIRCDLELGATEQKFNLLVGRTLQEDYARGEMAWCERYIPEGVKQLPISKQGQIVLTLEVLVGTDGKQRMSKSTGNYIGVSESANLMWEKLMRIPDEALEDFIRLLIWEGKVRGGLLETLGEARLQRKQGAVREAGESFRSVHRGLAREIVTSYCDSHAADDADAQYRDAGRGPSAEIRTIQLPATAEETTWAGYLAVKAGLAKSTSEVRNLLKDGGISYLSGAGTGPETWEPVGEQLQVPSRAGAPPVTLRKGKRQETTVKIVWV